MIIQIVKFESELPEEEVLAVAQDRLDDFRALPGLIQKYYVKLPESNTYGGVYIWDSMEFLSKYRQSALASSIPAAYKVKGAPTVEILDGLFQLRDSGLNEASTRTGADEAQAAGRKIVPRRSKMEG